MLASHKMKLVEEVISTFTREELFWLNGYIAGKCSTVSQAQAETVAATKPSINKLTITYGTESGNSKKLASVFAAQAKKTGINTKLVSLDQYRLNDLPKEEYFFFVINNNKKKE